MKISVVIPTVRAHTLDAAVRSIAGQSHPDWELLVVGQGSDPSLARALERAAALDRRVRVLHLPIKGVSRARNEGIAASTADVIALMDDDCEAQHDWLGTFSQAFECEPDLDVLGGSLVAPPARGRRLSTCRQVLPGEVRYAPQRDPLPPPGFAVLTANLAVRRRVFGTVGTFDEHLGPGTPFPAGEDPDFILRLEAAGCVMRSSPRAVMLHTHGRRYGVRAALAVLRGYAEGQGALAAKLHMMNDPRGAEWLKRAVSEVFTDRKRRVPNNLVRAAYIFKAYQRCRTQYRIDPSRPLLRRATP